MREWSSMATWTYSQPMPLTVSRRSPVTRCDGLGDAHQPLDVEVQQVAREP